MRYPSFNAFGSVWLTFAVLASGCSVVTALDGWTFEDDDAGSTHPGQMDAGRDAGRGRDAGPDCASGLTNCAGECTDLESSPEHCGACGSACSTPPNTVAHCTDGSCGFDCAIGFDDCNGDAEDGCEIEIASDLLNCGACAMACDTALSCEGGCRPRLLWALGLGGTDSERVTGVAVDPEGNVYVTGTFRESISIGGGSLVSETSADGWPSYDIFIASYTARGEHRWSRRGGGAFWDSATAIAFDGSGSTPKIHVAGYFQQTTNLGGATLMSQGGFDMFIASFETADGSYLGSRSGGGTGSDESTGIAVDLTGNIYVVGRFNGSNADFGQIIPLSSAGDYDVFVAAYPPNYTSVTQARWAKRFGSTSADTGNGIAVDERGNVYVTGAFSGTVSFGGDAFTSQAADIFVASFNSSGTHRWSRQGGGSSNDLGHGIAVDVASNAYVAGEFQGAAGLGGDPLEAMGGVRPDIFLASYDGSSEASGVHRWSRRAGGTQSDFVAAVAVSPSGEVFSTGHFYEQTDLGGGGLSSRELAAFVGVHHGTDGAHRASLAIGGPDGTAQGRAIAAGTGLICVGGSFSGSINVGAETLTYIAGEDAYIACFEP